MLSAIRTLLINQPIVSDLVSDRVYPVRYPQAEELPAITLRIVKNRPNHTKDGPSGLDEVSVTVEIYAKGYSETENIKNAVRRVLDFYSGEVSGKTISRISYQGEADGYEQDARIYVKDVDFIIFQNR